MRTIIATLIFLTASAGVAEARGLRGSEVRLGVVTTLYSSTSTEIDGIQDDTDIETIGIGAGLIGFVGGFCITDKIEIGGMISYEDQEIDGNDGSATLLGAYFDYNIPVGTSSAYAEVALLYQSTDGVFGADMSQQGISLGGGFKAFVADGGSLDIGLKVFWLAGEIDNGPFEDADVDTLGFLLHIGMSVWLGGGGGPQ